MRILILVAILFAQIAVSNICGARADTASDLADCRRAVNRGDNRQAVALCTRLLDSGDLTDEDRVAALVARATAHRNTLRYDDAIVDCEAGLAISAADFDLHFVCGNSYAGKGNYDLAIRHVEAALALNPDSAHALNSRGNLYNQQGKFDAALADFDAALRINPNFNWALLNRGIVLYNMGRFADAVDALKRANAVDRGNPYPVLWLALAERRVGGQSGIDIAIAAGQIDLDRWPGPIVRFYRDRALMFPKAEGENAEGLSLEPSRGEDCESEFYYGAWALIGSDKEAARRKLQHAAEICPGTWIERAGALAELKRM